MTAPARDGDDYDAFVHPTPHRQPENQLGVNPATGRMELHAPPDVGASPDPDAPPFFVAIARTRDLYSLAPEDIAWSPGQQFDADGRPLSIVEQDRLRGDA